MINLNPEHLRISQPNRWKLKAIGFLASRLSEGKSQIRSGLLPAATAVLDSSYGTHIEVARNPLFSLRHTTTIDVACPEGCEIVFPSATRDTFANGALVARQEWLINDPASDLSFTKVATTLATAYISQKLNRG